MGREASDRPRDDLPPVGGRYVIECLIGRGTFGEVFLARDARQADAAQVALKSQRVQSIESNQRFLSEVRAIANLNHPNIVRVLDIVSEADRNYLVMELLQGEPMSTRVSHLPVEPVRAVEWMTFVCEGLVHAHSRGVVHRDLSPRNIFFTDPEGVVKLIDFGLASEADNVTQEVSGTPAFMAPEQFESGATVDHRSDLYAVGAILHHLITGDTLFDSSRSGRSPRQRVRVLNPLELGHPVLADILFSLLHHDVEQRYQSAAGVLKDLRIAWDALRKGLTDAVPAAHREWVPAAGIASSALVGRLPLQQQLKEAMGRASEQKGSVVCVRGEAGSGKSSLASWLRHEALRLGAVPIRSGCSEVTQSFVFAAITEALSALPRLTQDAPSVKARIRLASENYQEALWTIAPSIARWLDLSPHAPEQGIRSEQAQRYARAQIAELLCALGNSASPVVLIVDDAQWMDASTQKVLQAVADKVTNRPVLLVLFVRSDLAQSITPWLSSAVQVELQTLSVEDIRTLLENEAGHDFPGIDDAAAAMLRASDGNPWLVTEAYRALREQKALEKSAPQWKWHAEVADRILVGLTPATLLAARLQALLPPERWALEKAAVWASDFVPSELGLTGQDLNKALLLGALVREESGTLSFPNARLRETVLQGLSEQALKQLHLDAAERRLLQGPAFKAVAVEHLIRAGALERAAPIAREAAAHAEATQAFDTALNLLRRVTRWVSEGAVTFDVEQQADLWLNVGQLALLTGQFRECVSALDVWLSLKSQDPHSSVNSPVARAQTIGVQAEAMFRLGEQEKTLHLHEQALAELSVRVPSSSLGQALIIVWHLLVAVARSVFPFMFSEGKRVDAKAREVCARLAGFAMTLYYADSYRALAAHMMAINRAEKLAPCRDKLNVFSHHAALATSVPLLNKRPWKYGQAAIAMAQALNDKASELMATWYLGLSYYCRAQWDKALEQFDQVELLAKTQREPLFLGFSRLHRHYIHFHRGLMSTAIESSRQLRSFYASYNDEIGAGESRFFMPQQLANVRDFEEAQETLQWMTRHVQEKRLRQLKLQLHAQQAFVSVSQGRAEEAVVAARAAAQAAADFSMRNVHTSLLGGYYLAALVCAKRARLANVYTTKDWITAIFEALYGACLTPFCRGYNLGALAEALEAFQYPRLARWVYRYAGETARKYELLLDQARIDRVLGLERLRKNPDDVEGLGRSLRALAAFERCGSGRERADLLMECMNLNPACFAASVGQTSDQTAAFTTF